MTAHLNEPVQPITDHRREVPVAIADLLGRMMAKKPEDRPATPGQVAEALESFVTGTDLAGLARRGLVLQHRKKSESQIAVEDAVTISPSSTADKAIPSSPSTKSYPRRDRWKLVLAGVLVSGAVVLALMLWLWSGGPEDGGAAGQNGTQDPNGPLNPAQVSFPEIFPPGEWHDLLKRRPIEVVWTNKEAGSDWNYNAERKLVLANCNGKGLLQLGVAPSGRYDFEIGISQDFSFGGFGIFFRGREEGKDDLLKIQADGLLFTRFAEKNQQVRRVILDAFPKKNQAYAGFRTYDSLSSKVSGRNLLKITVGSKGLEKVFWNGQSTAAKVCDPTFGDNPRLGAEGSFGIFMQDGNATFLSARLFVHHSPGDNP